MLIPTVDPADLPDMTEEEMEESVRQQREDEEMQDKLEREMAATPKVPRFDEVVLGYPPKEPPPEPMSLTERSMQTLYRQLENLNQRIAACNDRMREVGQEMASAIAKAEQQRVDMMAIADSNYARAVNAARQAHLADTRTYQSELAGLSANRDALTLAYEALQRHGG